MTNIYQLLPLLNGWDYDVLVDFRGYPTLPANSMINLIRFIEGQKGLAGWISFATMTTDNPYATLHIESDNYIADINAFGVNAIQLTDVFEVPLYDVPNSLYTLQLKTYWPSAYSEKLVVELTNPLAVPITFINLGITLVLITNPKLFFESLDRVTKGELSKALIEAKGKR